MLRSRLELELAPRCMGAMPILLLSALMAIMATILMPARLTGTTDRRGSWAGCSLVPGPGITDTDMDITATTDIAAATMAGLFTGTDIQGMDMVMDTRCPMAADTAAGLQFEADSPAAATMATWVAASMVAAVVDFTVVAVAM